VFDGIVFSLLFSVHGTVGALEFEILCRADPPRRLGTRFPAEKRFAVIAVIDRSLPQIDRFSLSLFGRV